MNFSDAPPPFLPLAFLSHFFYFYALGLGIPTFLIQPLLITFAVIYFLWNNQTKVKKRADSAMDLSGIVKIEEEEEVKVKRVVLCCTPPPPPPPPPPPFLSTPKKLIRVNVGHVTSGTLWRQETVPIPQSFQTYFQPKQHSNPKHTPSKQTPTRIDQFEIFLKGNRLTCSDLLDLFLNKCTIKNEIVLELTKFLQKQNKSLRLLQFMQDERFEKCQLRLIELHRNIIKTESEKHLESLLKELDTNTNIAEALECKKLLSCLNVCINKLNGTTAHGLDLNDAHRIVDSKGLLRFVCREMLCEKELNWLKRQKLSLVSVDEIVSRAEQLGSRAHVPYVERTERLVELYGFEGKAEQLFQNLSILFAHVH